MRSNAQEQRILFVLPTHRNGSYWGIALTVVLFGVFLSAPTLAAVFTVDSQSDVEDATPGDGVCETAAGNSVCTLRAAIQEANTLSGADQIILPALPLPKRLRSDRCL